MASLITCPHCGVRPKEEFTIKGDAAPVRPAATASDKEWHDYVYLRDNRWAAIANSGITSMAAGVFSSWSATL